MQVPDGIMLEVYTVWDSEYFDLTILVTKWNASNEDQTDRRRGSVKSTGQMDILVYPVTWGYFDYSTFTDKLRANFVKLLYCYLSFTINQHKVIRQPFVNFLLFEMNANVNVSIQNTTTVNCIPWHLLLQLHTLASSPLHSSSSAARSAGSAGTAVALSCDTREGPSSVR